MEFKTPITNIHGDYLSYNDTPPLVEHPITCAMCKNSITTPIETLSLIYYFEDKLNIESMKVYFCDDDCQQIYHECPAD